ncbi:MAG: flagellar type III secretion system pore protein FliP [Acidimicrobiia bacterium]
MPTIARSLTLLALLATLWTAAAAPVSAQTQPDGGVGVPGDDLEVDTPGTRLDIPAVVVPPPVEVPDVPSISVQVNGVEGGLTQTVSLVLLLTMGSLLPGLLLLTTSFTRFIVVLGLTRNAIGIQTAPPGPVLIGIALFLTLFVMKPVLTQVWDDAAQPLIDQEISLEDAYDLGYAPLRDFMLSQTREEDLRLFLDMAEGEQPESPSEIGATVLVPAFIVSELRTAFLIGFMVFIPFLVIDLIVSTILMALGMVMLPPTFISLPLKLLLFVLADGWVLLIGSLVSSVNGG